MISSELQRYIDQIHLPTPDTHKGQNGKVLIIGGSELFHAASQWALLVVSRMVDMVFYSSIPSNNELIQEAKAHFPNGIVISRQNLEDYIDEANVVLIGPGMERNQETEVLTNFLLQKYPHKKWVIDAGALQMLNPRLLNERCIITPHQKEFDTLLQKTSLEALIQQNVTILQKGQIDHIRKNSQEIFVEGGNVGMTKGGTGDVLAGLVAGLYCFSSDPFAVAVVASHVNKTTGDELFDQVGPFFNATDLANQIPYTLKTVFQF